MCGIAGYIGKGDRAILEAMTSTLTHRGPDDAGFFVVTGRKFSSRSEENFFGSNNPPSVAGAQSRSVSGGLPGGERGGWSVGLGHRRLSIIDLSPTGHQPMQSADGTVTIVFNGEIYNFQSIRDELKGYPWRGTSDTEVILAAYQAYGLECFKKMNGMFALALYDAPRDRLVMARDRLGKKPLYWGKFGGTVVFGSELKALLKHPAIKKEIDQNSLAKYLAFDYVPTPHSIFKNIYKLEAGHYLVYERGEIKKQPFWDITFGDRHDLTEAQVLPELDKHLARSVSSRLVSDVPLGIFLSGGLDSSTIAYYAQKASAQKIKTFSIGFTEKSFDESRYARQVAKQLATEHYEQIVTPKEAQDIIPAIGDILDEPVADYSIIPTLLLSRFTRKHVTVALGGDGGDELFFGYPTFPAERAAAWLNNPLGKGLLTFLKNLAPHSNQHFHLRFKLERLLAGLGSDPRHRHHDWMGNRTSGYELQTTDLYEDVDGYFEQYKNASRWQQLQALYLRTYLMDQVLVKVDRASMAASLEVRAPFLDYELVDFVTSLHYSYTAHGWQTKYLLKRLMRDKLPAEIVQRKKQGFAVPVGAWFAGELAPMLRDVLSRSNVERAGLVDPQLVERLVEDHIAGRVDYRKELWNLFVLHQWSDKWGH